MASVQNYWFYQADANSIGYFTSDFATTLTINQFAQNNSNCSEALNTGILPKTKFTINDNTGTLFVCQYNGGVITVDINNAVSIPIVVVATAGVLILGQTCVINVDNQPEVTGTLYLDASSNLTATDADSGVLTGTDNTLLKNVGAGNSGITFGSQNTVVGALALNNGDSSSGSVAIGYKAANDGVAFQSVVIGSQAYGNGIMTNNQQNVVIGAGAGLSVTDSFTSVVIGAGGGQLDASFDNVSVGAGSNNNLQTACTGNTVLGCQSSLNADTLTGSVIVGYQSTCAHSNAIVLGTLCASAEANSLNLSNMTFDATATSGVGTLPVAPEKFLRVHLNGAQYKIPLYNV